MDNLHGGLGYRNGPARQKIAANCRIINQREAIIENTRIVHIPLYPLNICSSKSIDTVANNDSISVEEFGDFVLKVGDTAMGGHSLNAGTGPVMVIANKRIIEIKNRTWGAYRQRREKKIRSK